MKLSDFTIGKIHYVGTFIPKEQGIRKCVVDYDSKYSRRFHRKGSILLLKEKTGPWHVRTESIGPEGYTYRLVDKSITGKTYSIIRDVAFKEELKIYQVIEPDYKKRRDIVKVLREHYPHKIKS